MYLNTAGLILLAQNTFFASKETVEKNRKIDIFVGTYNEFDSAWYLNIGSVIVAS
jgi:hypothetical protein